MRQKQEAKPGSAEKTVRDIRRGDTALASLYLPESCPDVSATFTTVAFDPHATCHPPHPHENKIGAFSSNLNPLCNTNQGFRKLHADAVRFAPSNDAVPERICGGCEKQFEAVRQCLRIFDD